MACRRIGSLATGLCAVLVGCTQVPQQPAPVVATAAAPQPAAPISANGVYNGVMQLVRGSAATCGTQNILTLRVADNAFRYVLNQPQVPWQPVRSFDVTIALDGSFQTQSGTAYIRGRLNGGHMQGEIVGDACGYQFEADNSGTW